MKKKRPFRFFQFFTYSVFFLFMSVLAVVTITAYTRKSGHTGLSMVQIQKMRAADLSKPEANRERKKSL